jgi:hypothetical protein
MTSYDPLRDRANELLERLTSLLAEESLQLRIDEPVDDAAAGFKCPEVAECSQTQFHQTIAQFLCYVREQVLANGKAPLWPEGLGEAMALLEDGYHGTYSDGYYGALQDALDPSYSGLEMVLERMAGTIKVRWRETYARWAIARYVASADWEVRCALTALIIDRCGEWLPPELQRCQAAQLEGCIPELLQVYLGTTRPIHSGAAGLLTPLI